MYRYLINWEFPESIRRNLFEHTFYLFLFIFTQYRSATGHLLSIVVFIEFTWPLYST